MMGIKDKSAYLHVVGDNIDDDHPYGDIDRLPITFLGEADPWSVLRQGLMPARHAAGLLPYTRIPAEKLLSGQDIVFLAEGVGERRVLMPSGYEPSTVDPMVFSRQTSFYHPSRFPDPDPEYATPDAITRAHHEIVYMFAKSLPTRDGYVDDDPFVRCADADLRVGRNDFMTIPGTMRSSKILDLFEDQKTLAKLAPPSDVTEYQTPHEGTANYVDEMPMAYSIDRGLLWHGGRKKNYPYDTEHRYGGIFFRTWSCRHYVELPNVPASVTPTGEVWVRYSFHYIEKDYDGRRIDEGRCYYVTKLGDAVWDAATKKLGRWSEGTQVLSLLRRVAQEKFGWTFGVPLPDEYGRKELSYSEDGVVVIPVDRTKWW